MAGPRNSPAELPLKWNLPAWWDVRKGPIPIRGRSLLTNGTLVRLRATSLEDREFFSEARIIDGEFSARFPDDFKGASVSAQSLFLEARVEGGAPIEGAVFAYDSKEHRVPRLPGTFVADFLDARGNRDERSSAWPEHRHLANLYMASRAARLVGIGRPDFDLAYPPDFAWFRDHLSLYEFDFRDRDWSSPLGHRVARTFWQSVWDTWFNATNDHPLDGNPRNPASTNYLPYAFSNDFADMLIVSWWRLTSDGGRDRHAATMNQEAVENLIAMQHRGTNNFSVPDTQGRQHHYTRGAFRYGMFENGVFMTEKTGWFYNPANLDYVDGGVLNARAIWGLGESRRFCTDSRLNAKIEEAIRLGIQFCLVDGREWKYARRTRAGHYYWRDAGEHAYLVLGMLAASEKVPDLRIEWPDRAGGISLAELSVDALNALVDLNRGRGQWSIYPNVDSMAVAALCEGVRRFPKSPDAVQWRETAVRVGASWLEASAPDYPARTLFFGLRRDKQPMTLNWGRGNTIYFYQAGHWLHAFAALYAITGDARWLDRSETMVAYLNGSNPWQVRMANELGGIYNWVEDTDRDGIEDFLKQDMYPESTAFCQIGILYWLRLLSGQPGGK